MTRCRLSCDAERDLDDIKSYLMSQGGTDLARYVLGEIRLAIRFIATRHGIGHMRPDLTDEPVKFWPIFSYLIVYDPAAQPLGVARVLHGSQNLETMFRNAPRGS